jgi:hypothetical protein
MGKSVSIFAAMAALLLACTSAQAWSPKLQVNEDMWIQIGFLGQAQFEAVQDGSGNNNKWSNDFFARRARLMGQGSVHEKVKFFFDTDIPNAGKDDETDNDLVWNDGFIDLQFMPEFNLSFGRILVPFSVENKASAALLLGIDYNINATKIPTLIDRAFWRDDGIEVRGILFNGLVDYRAGLFRGERDKDFNGDDDMRSTGMVMINLGDAQPGWFYNMNSLGALKVLSFSAGYDYIGNSDVENHKAWNLGLHLEQPVGNGRIVGSATYYDWDGPYYEGKTSSVQAGYLLPCPFNDGSYIQPVLRWLHQDNDNTDVELDTFAIGLNYFLKGHNINFKVDYSINDKIIDGDRVDAIRFQTQLLF